MAPLGVPVVPLVKWSSAMSSGSVGPIAKDGTGLLHEGSQILCARDDGGLPVLSDEQDLFKARDRRRE